MGEYIKPEFTAEDFETGGFDDTPVPAGTYNMIIGAVTMRRGKNEPHNRYLNVMLKHTEDLTSKGSVFATVMIEGTAQKDGRTFSLAGQLARFLVALGISKEDAAAVEVTAEGEATPGAKGIPVDLLLNGDRIQVENTAVRASLKITEWNGASRNEVKSIFAIK